MSNPADEVPPPQNPDQPGSGGPSENAPPAQSPDVNASMTDGGEAPPGDGLPEWEPLTPELVEDEAIRGDFVMRWAVVGLAILLGCSQIAETKTLIHIRSGEYLAQHGFLPPAKDVFSYTRAEAPWVNLSWLFDLLAAGVHGLGGGIALTVFQTLVAAAIFGFVVHTVRPGIRTWWGSICAALALLACFRQFTIQPELITLLGTAAVLWLLVRTQEGTDSRGQWALIPILWAWSQLDSRAFLGWGLLLLFGVGEAIGAAAGRPGFREPARRRQFWLIAGGCFLVAGLHPFTYQSWLSPGRLYGVEYPAWREAYPQMTRIELSVVSMLSGRYWSAINFEGVAGIYLAFAALAAMLLNARRVPIAHLLMFAGINAAAVLASHELASASLVNCVLATLNAQDWFLATYGQTYSTQGSFLLFSRGGRAVTVLGMFALAYVIISGRIDGANGKRTGIGFDPELQQQMSSYERAVVDTYDDRPFSFVVRQGDLLIWAGQKSFIDSRLELFHSGSAGDSNGEDTILRLHDKTRRSLRKRDPDLKGSGDRPHWRKLFDRYEITHVMPRMSGLSLSPNYRTFDDLLRSQDWKLTRLTPALAVFYRADKRQDKALKAYVDSHHWNAVQLAFRLDGEPVKTDDKDKAEAHVWPASTSSYQKFLSLPRNTVPGDVTQSTHEFHYATQENLGMPQRLAALHLAIRAARAGLRADPNSAEGYQVLGSSYSVLDQLEGLELRRFGVELPQMLRYYQIAAARQSLTLLEPNDPFVHQELASFYGRLKKLDLALRHLKEYMRLQSERPSEKNDEAKTQQLDQLSMMADQIEQRVAQVHEQISLHLANSESRVNVALFAYQNGAVLAAIRLLDEDKIALLESPPAQVMYAGWLIEAGRAEEADQTLRTVEQQVGPGVDQLAGWRDNAVSAAWAQGNYERVVQLYEDAVVSGEKRRLELALMSGPFLTSSTVGLSPDRYPWLHAAAVEEVSRDRPYELGSTLFNLALCRLEQGDLPAAQAALKQALDRAPDSPLRPLLILYWQCLTDEILEPEPPSEWIPISTDLFAAEDQP